jgi:hypothetical protein
MRKNPLARLRHLRRARPDQHASPDRRATGHIPFTPRAKSLEYSLRVAKARHDNYIGVEYPTLALVAMYDGGRASYLVGARRAAGNLACRHFGPLPAGQLIPARAADPRAKPCRPRVFPHPEHLFGAAPA